MKPHWVPSRSLTAKQTHCSQAPIWFSNQGFHFSELCSQPASNPQSTSRGRQQKAWPLYSPPCLWHAWRVVLAARLVCRNSYPEPLQSSSGIPAGSPPSGGPCRIPAESFRGSNKFSDDLTESQVFQRTRHLVNLKSATPLKRNPVF